MNIEILTQPILSNGTPFILGEEIIKLLSKKKPKTKEISFMFSLVKSNAIDMLKPALTEFIENGGVVNFYVDSDKRFLTNPLIPELLDLGCNLYTYINPEGNAEFQYRGIIVESAKSSDVYLTSGNLSLTGLYNSHNIITHISYDISKDKEEYKNFKNSILSEDLTNKFIKISTETLPKIIDDIKKSTSIPSISDFTKNDFSKVDTNSTKKIDLSEPNISIEIDDNVDFLIPQESPVKPKNEKKQTLAVPSQSESTISIDTSAPIVEYTSEPIYYGADEAIDVENLLFESKMKSVINSTAKPIKTNAFSSDNLVIDDEIQLKEQADESNIVTKKIASVSKTSIFMFESPKITHKGACAEEIKIPIYIRDLLPEFWEWPESYEVTGNQAKIKSRICTFEIIDTMEPENIIEDKAAKLFQRVDESSFSIYSSELKKLDIEENDIIRLIKVSSENDSYYTCEIIRKTAKEYQIWEQFCTQNFKNSSRKYGIM